MPYFQKNTSTFRMKSPLLNGKRKKKKARKREELQKKALENARRSPKFRDDLERHTGKSLEELENQ